MHHQRSYRSVIRRFGQINRRGEVAGIAENNLQDKNPETECRPEASVNGTGPQVLDFEAVIWGPGPGEIRELPPLPGDTVGMALGINDESEAVGVLDTCAKTVFEAGAWWILGKMVTVSRSVLHS